MGNLYLGQGKHVTLYFVVGPDQLCQCTFCGLIDLVFENKASRNVYLFLIMFK